MQFASKSEQASRREKRNLKLPHTSTIIPCKVVTIKTKKKDRYKGRKTQRQEKRKETLRVVHRVHRWDHIEYKAKGRLSSRALQVASNGAV